MAKNLVEMASEIITAQSAAGQICSEDLTEALKNTFNTLKQLQQIEADGGESPSQEKETVTITAAKSIQRHKIICMECGESFKTLSPKHLKSHGLTGKEYRKKHGFTMRQPLCAKALSEARKQAAIKRGLPEKLQKIVDQRKKDAKKKNK